MNLFKKTIYLYMVLLAFLLAGCNSTSIKNQLPTSKPKDFNFVFNYGVNAKNQLDTVKGTYTKDMVLDPLITTDLKLSDEEMSTIYSEMKKINILAYPENFNPKTNVSQTPFSTYSIKIITSGIEKNIVWKDENVAETKDAVQLRELFKKIVDIIMSKEEYKKLPDAKGGYD